MDAVAWNTAPNSSSVAPKGVDPALLPAPSKDLHRETLGKASQPGMVAGVNTFLLFPLSSSLVQLPVDAQCGKE